MSPAVAAALERITGRAEVAMDPDWIPDHERRARRRRRPRPALVRVAPELPCLLSIRVLPVEPKRLTA